MKKRVFKCPVYTNLKECKHTMCVCYDYFDGTCGFKAKRRKG
jgi:hypothetical protein